MPYLPFLEGFALGGGLIIAIGAQNAFILRQGLLREHVFILCFVASLSDALLILLGVLGMGALVAANEDLLFYITIFGAVFLTAYALLAAKRTLKPDALKAKGQGAGSLKKALSTLLAFTFLNPHVYLDTVVLVGGIGGQYLGAEKLAFTLGAMAASFCWFFTLGYGARWLAPIFARPIAWRILDGVIAFIMALLAWSLYARL